MKQRLDELETKKADLEIVLSREKIEQTPLTKEQIVFWISRFKDGDIISRFKDGDIDDPAYRSSLVDIFVSAIFLYDDKIVITFNWKNGTKTVSLAELEDAMGSGEADAEASNCNSFECSHLDDCPPPSPKEQN